MEIIHEWCQKCEEEVELECKFQTQKCPNCGADINPCSLCDMDVVDCSDCELDI